MASSNKPLQVLVTRPAGQAEKLMAGVEALGGVATHCPLIAIEALNENRDKAINLQLKQRMMALDKYRHIIFISTNAVRFGLAEIERYWPQYPVDLHWHGIGAATVQAMIAYDLPVSEATVTMNTESLLDSPLLKTVNNDKVLIVRGVGGRPQLAETLKQRGAQLDYAECYHRRLPAYPSQALNDIFIRHDYDALCVSSGESLKNLCKLLTKAGADSVKSVALIVPGQRVATLAQQNGFKVIKIADNASDSSMLAALKQLASLSN
jgi:uroporphyrinogen-III synthase